MTIKYMFKLILHMFKDLIKNRFASGVFSRALTNLICEVTTPRPRAFSLWSHVPKPQSETEQGPVGEYTTWPMLTERKFSPRHLPPADQSYIDELPSHAPYSAGPTNPQTGEVTALFKRAGAIKTGRSSVLFMFFAQWFTDSVLRTHPEDRRKNTSNHNIDLCQIYGLTEKEAGILRSKIDGKLTCQRIGREDYLDYLGEKGADGKWKPKNKYEEDLPHASVAVLNKVFENFDKWSEERKCKLYATGLERGNSSIGYVAISTVFMREHNRICDVLLKRNSNWDDERLYSVTGCGTDFLQWK